MHKLIPFRGAGGGGGSSGDGPRQTRTPDSLRSKDTVEVLLGLCEGEIEGLDDGLKSFFIGDTPLLNSQNEPNFTYQVADILSGVPSPSLTSLLLGGQSTNTAVNVQLAFNVPVTRTSPNGPFDFIDVRLIISQLFRQDDTGIFQAEGKFRIEWKVTSNPTWTLAFGADITITGKTTSTYVREFRIAVPQASGTYDIRVTRLSPASDTLYTFEIRWESFQGIVAKSFAYDNLAIAHFVAEASDQFSSIPNFSGIYKLKKIKVPPSPHYNPVTKVYDANIWDGSFQVKWSDNPAWVLYDFALNTRFGISHYYPVSIDPDDMYQAARWCDEMVTNGQGGFHARWTFNDLIGQARNGQEMLKYIAGTFNAAAFDDQNGTIHLKVDKDDPALAIFSPENVVEGQFEYAFSDITSRFNDVTVSFINPTLDWQEDRRRVFDQAHIDKYGRIPLDFIAVGCINVQEALRRAYYKLITSITEVMSVKFRTNRFGLHISPFDVILIADPDLGYSLSGRIKSLDVTRTIATLRDAIYLEAGVLYHAQFTIPNLNYPNSSDDKFVIITSSFTAAGTGYVTTLTFPSALSTALPEEPVFSLASDDGLSTGLPKPFRVMRIDEVDGDPDNAEIVCVEINRLKWDAVDNTTTAGTIDYSSLKDTVDIPSPTAVSFTEKFDSFNSRYLLTVSPTFDFNAYKFYSGEFQVWSRPTVVGVGAGSFVRWPLIDNDTIVNHPVGLYEFKILAISTSGRVASLANATVWSYTVLHSANMPPPPTGLTLVSSSLANADGSLISGFEVSWIAAQYPVVAQYEIQWKKAADVSWNSMLVDGQSVRAFIGNLIVGQSYNVRVRTIVTVAVRSDWATANAVLGNDTTPPGPPTNLVAVGVVLGIETTWTNPTDTDYSVTEIWYNTVDDRATATKIGEVAFTSFTDSGLQAGTTRFYWVRARDTSGNVGNFNALAGVSATALAGTGAPDTTPPGPPTNLQGVGGLRIISLTWINPTDADFSFIEVWENTVDNRGTASKIAEVAADWYIRTGLAQGVIRYYWVRAVDFSGNIGNFNSTAGVAVATGAVGPGDFDPGAPGVPAGLTLTQTVGQAADGTTVVKLRATWTPNADIDFAYYEWGIKEGAGGNYVFGNTSSPSVEWVVRPGFTYFVKIRAVDLAQNRSAYSAEVSLLITGDVTPPGVPSAFTVTATFKSLWLSWTNPVDADLAYIEVYENTVNNSATSTKLANVNGSAFVRSGLNSGDQRFYWLKSVDFSGNKSAFSAGAFGTTTAVSSLDIGAGAVTSAAFASGIRPIEIVSTLPSTGNFEGRLVYLTTDDKIYRHTGAAWISTVAAVDVTGTITNTQIADGAITTPKLTANVITANELATNSVTATKLTANSVIAGKIAAAAVSTAELAANSISADKVVIGLRNIQITGLEFSAPKLASPTSTNYRLSWTAGSIIYIDDVNVVQTVALTADFVDFLDGTITNDNIIFTPNVASSLLSWNAGTVTYIDALLVSQTVTINAGVNIPWTTGILYVYWTISTTNHVFQTTTNFTTASAVGNVIVATYRGGGKLITYRDSIYVYWVKGATVLNATSYRTTGFDTNNLILATYRGSGNVIANYGGTIIDGSKIITGTIVGNLLAVSDVVTLTAQISDAIISDAKIITLDAAKIIAGSILSGTITVNGQPIGTVQSNAANPASVVNAGSTLINPGKVLISGATTLASWRNGGDNTKIEGGSIAANTITANKIEIGLRGLTITGIEISYNKAISTLTWSSGTLTYTDDNGVTQTVSIASGSQTWPGSTIYLYWVKGATALSTTTSLAVALTTSNVLLATYAGSTNLVANYGRTIVDGSQIIANSITSSNLSTGTLITLSAQIGLGLIDTARIGDLQVDTIKITNGAITTSSWAAKTGSAALNNPLTFPASGSGTILTPWTTVNSMNVFCAAGAVRLIHVALQYADEASYGNQNIPGIVFGVQARIIIGGVAIDPQPDSSNPGGHTFTLAFAIQDAVSRAGSILFELQLQAQASSANLGRSVNIRNPIIHVLETKR